MADPQKYGAVWNGINPLTGQVYKWGDNVYYDSPVAPSPSSTKNMLIHVKLDFVKKSHPKLDEFADGVSTKMLANATVFTNPPAALAALAPARLAFHTSIPLANGGGKQLNADMIAKREVVLGLLRTLAAYVQAIPGISLADALKSGFDVIELGSHTPVTLNVPAILSFTNVNHGQLGAKIKGVAGATGYEFQIVPVAGGAAITQSFSSTRNIVLTGLVAGTLYSIQVRARAGNNAASAWSEAVTHMCT